MPEPASSPVFDGALCRAARALLGISQQELCTTANCSRKLLNDFENGLIEPKASKLSDIRKALADGGAVFVRIDDILAVGVLPEHSSRRSARGRSFALDVEASDEEGRSGNQS